MGGLSREMHARKSVLNGWSAVLNLHQSAVNDFIRSQWNEQTPVKLCWSDDNAVTQVDLRLAAPQVSFRQADNTVDLAFPVTEARLKQGTLDKTRVSVFSDNPDDPDVDWASSRTLDDTDAFSISGSAPLVMTGTPENSSICLNLADGSFALNPKANDTLKADRLSVQIRRWVSTRSVRPEVVSYKFSPSDNGRHIRPTGLRFGTIVSASGEPMLQLYLATNGDGPQNASINLTEPIQTDTGSTFSLMVDSKIIIDDIVTEFDQCPGRLKLSTVSESIPSSERATVTEVTPRIWFAQTSHPMQYSGTVDFGGRFPTIENHAELGMNFVGSPDDGLVIEHYITPDSNLDLQLTVDGNFPVQVTGSGKDQKMKFSAGPMAVTANGMAEYAVKAQLEDFLFNDIKPNMTSFDFDPVATLLLNHLSFAGNVPQITEAQLPGDFLITGVFEKKAQ